MKLILLLTAIACFQSSAEGLAQTISLNFTNTPLEQVFKELKQQTGYSFVYTRAQLKNTVPVNCKARDIQLKDALDLCFRGQPLLFVIEDRYVVVQTKANAGIADSKPPLSIDISGRIVNENGDVVAGATITAKNSNRATSADVKGEFSLKEVAEDDILVITSIGYYKEEIRVNRQNYLVVRLKIAVNSLDETIVKGYYTTSKRLNTGSVGKVTAKEIALQPVSNPLAALQGRIPGLLITQANGLPGSNFKVQIRGQNSIQQGNDPFYIIDGVPFMSGNLTQFSGISANNPLNTLNPLDIESIEVLKDADATAIYGSRGANGVILITTKRSTDNTTSLNFQVYKGWGKTTRMMNFMNTGQYVAIRKEAFVNDGRAPTLSTAYDFLAWDSTRYTDWKKLLIGGTAHTTNADIRFSGGNIFTRFSLASNFYKETTVFPKELGNTRVSILLNASHLSSDSKLKIQFSVTYGNDKSNLIPQDLTSLITLPPNAPAIYDPAGKLNWREGGFAYNNPFGLLQKEYNGTAERLTTRAEISYKPNRSFLFRTSFGYNSIGFDETSFTPISSQDPANNPTGLSIFGRTSSKGWIIEPQAEYSATISKKGSIKVLLGSTLQSTVNGSNSVTGLGYTDDALLKSISGAASVSPSNGFAEYRYQAAFGRLNFNWDNKYIANLTGRRDGSSRFGPGKQFANFGAIGLGWIFSNEKSVSNSSLLTFGKLRFSYGITGNDQIGDYKYLDIYASTQYPYQGSPSLRPVQLFNDDYSWEQIKKIESAVELGFLQNRLLLNLNLFLNRSDNQYLFTNLPGQTGFTGITQSFPGVVENKGIEIEIRSTAVKTKDFQWTSSFNISVERNKLIEFPGLESSAYAGNYLIGKPLSNVQGYTFLGVNAQTGVYNFSDLNRDGLINNSDRVYIGTTNPNYYGGFQNNLQYRKWSFDFFFQFVNQKGRHPVYSSFNRPGVITNQPMDVLDRWQNPGAETPFQRYTRTAGTAAYSAGSLVTGSSAVLTNASFIRLKNLSVSYRISSEKKSKVPFQECLVFLRTQNILTFTRYAGADPENQTLTGLPPLKMIVAGFNINF